jgi:lipopolysaccharide transport system ATP-binding protein
MDVIKVENLYKQYRLGQVSTGSIAHDLNRWWHAVRGKEDPYQKITGLNNRDQADSSEYVWALQDINFSVKQGEVLGIIGKNGAGKSTLLKILSKVTSPTKGNIKVKGRIASLLEVGTGFHPELTGRENIFLNGAILGMTKAEIRSKFDEIVVFSGVEKYIDTPVKRYSSGMYVRLAFAVAAHLEPEILIVDEVLAVGDAEFQKKCLGKMKDVSGEGRTVLFVSHNMAAVKSLCTEAIWVNKGIIELSGNSNEIVDQYVSMDKKSKFYIDWNVQDAPGNDWITMNSVSLTYESQEDKILNIKTPFQINFDFNVLKNDLVLNLSMHIYSITDECVFVVTTELPAKKTSQGKHSAVCFVPGDLLNNGSYYVKCFFVKDETIPIFTLEDTISFEVHDERQSNKWHGQYPGLIRPNLNFKIKKHE